MKRVLALVMSIIFVLCLAACGGSAVNETEAPTEAPTIDERITIPDIEDTDEATAKNLLSSNALIPKIEYEYNDSVEQGNVIRTSPNIGSKVDKNSKVTVYISKGSSTVQSTSSRASWKYVSTNGKDNWMFNNPYIIENTLYIECTEVTFARAIKWQDTYNEGKIVGVASITDSFDKTVPVEAKYEKQSWDANEKQTFTIEVPLSDLNESRPTDMYLRLFTDNYDDYNNQINVYISFYMTW